MNTWKAITDAETNLNQAKNHLEPLDASKAKDNLKKASDKIKLARKNLRYARERPAKFKVTSLNLKHDRIFCPHYFHRNGKDADIGLMKTGDARGVVPECKTSCTKAHTHLHDRTTANANRKYTRETGYDRPLTRLLIEVFRSVGASKILIHDRNITQDTIVRSRVSGHHHHLHIDFD